MALAYKRVCSYHPLIVSLANTAEPLYPANRPGNRPSHEGAHHYIDRSIDLCRRAGVPAPPPACGIRRPQSGRTSLVLGLDAVLIRQQ